MKKILSNLGPSWYFYLKNEFEKDYINKLSDFVESEYEHNLVYPTQSLIFNALNSTPLSNVKVVILGQDPYHGANQADGLCFSVPSNVPNPPSLRNIFKELKLENENYSPTNGNLLHWAKQGVLLLNSVLTVRAMQPNSHAGRGWEILTDSIIELINNQKSNVVFMLWGAYAHKKTLLINQSKHLILQSAHPSPLSAYRGFLGCNHFNICNEYLQSKDVDKIIW